ncbi:9369_t:CDS:2 [Entrophospora sp. SA101]|nr:3284_t:CDS:2 [Entrophospora sp. SA101]CAJ0875384.1 9369_t:CDS:2 [Entrophospora sp. SA101]CAJ0912181.1 4608_t:CDS:2 [Entrophospora sp. SA101]
MSYWMQTKDIFQHQVREQLQHIQTQEYPSCSAVSSTDKLGVLIDELNELHNIMPKLKRNNYVTMKFALEKRSGRSGSHYNNRPSTISNNKDNNLNVIFSLNEGVGIDDEMLLENPPYKIHFSSIDELISPSTKSRSYNKSQKDPTAKTYIPRLQNEFMLFRKNYSKGLKNQKKSDRAASKISTNAKKEWNNVSPQVRLYFIKLVELAAKLHKEKYPNYAYIPKRKDEKNINSKQHNYNGNNTRR